MRKYIAVVMLCVSVAALTASCFDAREIDGLTYVLAIGIDKGVTERWRLTVQFPDLKEEGNKEGTGDGSGTSKGGKGGYTVITVESPSFFTGLNLINSSVPRELNFMHTSFLVVSEELAKSGDLGEYLAPIVRYRQVRRILNVIVSKTSAMEFIKENQPTVGTTLPKTMQIMLQEAYNTGFLVHVTLNDFYDAIKSTYRQPFACLAGINNFNNFKESDQEKTDSISTGGQFKAGEIPRMGGAKVEFFGSALFDDGKMVGELNGDETRLMQMVTGDFKRGFFTIPDPNNPELALPQDIRMSRMPKVKVSLEGDRPVVNLKINLEGDLLAVQSRVNYESEELKPFLEDTFKNHIKEGIDGLVEKCQSLNVDVFRFGRTAVRQFGTIQEWEDYNWLKRFKDIKVITEVQFDIRRTGSMLKSSPLVTSEGKK